MYTMRHKDDVSYFVEWRLCASCMRMFCLSTTPHIMMVHKGMIFHSHIRCPPLKKQMPKLIGG